MPKSRKKKRPPKRVLALPDLEQSKTAVLNTLTSKSGQRSYDRAITVSSIGTVPSRALRSTALWSCDTGFISNRSSMQPQQLIFVWPRSDVSHLKPPIPGSSVRNSPPESDELRVYAGSEFVLGIG